MHRLFNKALGRRSLQTCDLPVSSDLGSKDTSSDDLSKGEPDLIECLPTLSSESSNGSSLLQTHAAHAIMAETLYCYAQRERFFSGKPEIWNGVALRLAKRQYVMFPPEDPRMSYWLDALASLNCGAALTMTSAVVAGIACTLPAGATEVALSPVDRVQVMESIEELSCARKAQGAAFVRSEGRLVVWCDQVQDLMSTARMIETKMVNYVWQKATGVASVLPTSSSSGSLEKLSVTSPTVVEGVRRGPGGEKLVTTAISESDTEKAQLRTLQERQTPLLAPLHRGLSIALNLLIQGLVLRKLLIQSLADGNWMRLALVVLCVPAFFIIMFFTDNIISGVLQLIGPIRQMSLNSRYYSAIAPERISSTLPHITIQIPVYKEDLDSVLVPTFESVNRAIRTYELQGGTASILVSEDGLLLLDDVERQKRLDYYDLTQAAFVARPGHNVDGFVRRGRFKKASNLNFTCSVSMQVEEIMNSRRPQLLDNWSNVEEEKLYNEAFEEALRAAHPLAQGSGNIRIGEYILLLDCDTRVPEDCLLDAASEMSQCPDVAVLQHCSGVMQVTQNNYFEAGIAFFTRCVNFSISWVVANGDVAPFMGHNAFLRWSALQEAAFLDSNNGNTLKIWCETTVSEDFEMALRLLSHDYIVRWATYTDNAFLEGVSLTYGDELNRWQKYAFGVSELVFNPLWQWPYKGPITPLFRKFIWARQIPAQYKCCAMSYMFSYYAIACGLPLTIALSLAQGWFAPVLEGSLLDVVFLAPFKALVALLVVFLGLGSVAQIAAKFRSRRYKGLTALKEHIVWLPFFCIFFAGLSYHIMTSLFAHVFGYNMSWGSTKKSLDDSNFFVELPLMMRSHWKQLLITLVLIAGLAVLESTILPLDWQLRGGFTVIFPPLWVTCGHLLSHFVLNPQLLRFSF